MPFLMLGLLGFYSALDYGFHLHLRVSNRLEIGVLIKEVDFARKFRW